MRVDQVSWLKNGVWSQASSWFQVGCGNRGWEYEVMDTNGCQLREIHWLAVFSILI